MKFAKTHSSNSRSAQSAFTMVEVLAAMLFMAIVIPVAVEGLRTASLAGEVGMRKAVAARIANKVLSELKVTGQLTSTGQSGTVREGSLSYRWTLQTTPWTEDSSTPMTLATVQVTYPAHGRDFDVKLSTLVAANTQ
jgi:type II secretory pathway pseudopilin PulG